MRPAIRYAELGFPASQYLVDIIGTNQHGLSRFAASAEVFLPGGRPPAKGQIIVRNDYAHTLQTIAHDGPDALYGGNIGEIVADEGILS